MDLPKCDFKKHIKQMVKVKKKKNHKSRKDKGARFKK